jgi:spore maturation protein CgeB
VNELVFRNYGEEKTVDIGFHMVQRGNKPRIWALHQISVWADEMNKVVDVRTIKHDVVEYAKAFNRAKLSVNVSQVPGNRPHRLFDAMACRSCVISTPQPNVEEAHSPMPGEHYLEFDPELIAGAFGPALENGVYQSIADAGFAFIQEYHTWAKRAPELRAIIEAVL